MKNKNLPEIIKDPEASAEEAGLIYVHDLDPGIRRKLKGKIFHYFDL